MSSTFGGLNTATTSLWAQRRGLDVTGQNIANVNTEGYSRQRAELRTVGGSTVPAVFSVNDAVGGGVSAEEVTRIRDVFLEGRGQVEHSNRARLTAESEALEQIEMAFREPGETGIQSQLANMWSAWDDVANNPQDEPARSQLLQETQTLVNGLHTTSAALTTQWNQTHENLAALVTDVNSAAQSVADLNKAILSASHSGLPTNHLADSRDLLVLGLAEKIGATAMPMADGVVDVVVGGMSLVSASRARTVELTGPAAIVDVDGAAVPRITLSGGGPAVVAGGTAGGQLATLGTMLPSYLGSLDDLAQQLATGLNAAHANGYDLSGAPGGPLLGTGADPLVLEDITAANVAVLISDPRGIAASAVAPTAAELSAGQGSLDDGNADAISQLRLDRTGPDATYREMIVQLGVRAAVSNRNLHTQEVITSQVDAARESVAGVNLDEEMTNMLQFQHAYSAAARLVTAIDEMLDQLINRTGIVGR